MTYVTWTEKLATGVEALDTDHKALFDMVDQFHEAYMGGKGAAALEQMFAALMDYTDYHFRREEGLMEQAGYPGLDAHRRLHQSLKAQVHDLHDRYLRGELQGEETDLCLEMMAFLNNWLHFHIAEEDVKIREHLG